jgi:CubicO group peptidase (beta-lactamase class C family)
MTQLSSARRVLDRGLSARAFSAVSAEIGTASGPIWTYASGTLSFNAGAAAVDTATIFDLASLTKVLATAAVAMALVDRRGLDIDAPVASFVPQWTGADRARVTLRDLLEHSSGLPAYREYFRQLSGRDAYTTAIAAEPLDYIPREKAIYSDLGFIVLGFALERFGGQSLADQFNEWRAKTGVSGPLAFRPPVTVHRSIAATEEDAWRGRLLQGEVHDENAAALGGAAAHAGLFGTAAAVGQAARWWLALLHGRNDTATAIAAQTARTFARRSTVPGSSRALAWDTMLSSSSCGTRMSARALGHTGFTGTSLWIDPEQDLYFVLLTNRVHPTRKNDTIQQVRREFHDAALSDLAHVPDNA